ncbi:MAG: DNA topoisomerase I [Nitrososphaerota archaeon]|nr:DNA topoisomerase I [Candidatus Bathyarchaeota archaeon]MDW8049033.1 DNA topoisomerase I [Nitrososphaerota archaeon]
MDKGVKTILVLSEKPNAAERIAKALDAKGTPKKREFNGVPYYEAFRDNERLIIVAALGHLYTVAPKIRERSIFPVFNFEWAPRYLVEKDAKETKNWIDLISTLSKEADEFVLATDYDIEGETLGYTILKFACGGKDVEAKRMKFSTLTADELREAYSNLLEHIDNRIVEAGECRHFLDAMYGINLSRAMTVAAKNYSGRYALLSTGRVQGPTLKFLVEREKQINCFVPTPYWSIKARINVDGTILEAEYEREVIEMKDTAQSIVNECSGKKGRIKSVETRMIQQSPPAPFDLGTLQAEAYSYFKYTPRQTVDIAERLYLDALISYPRTSSQKLPPSINYREIIESLSRENTYKPLCQILLEQENLVPNEGKKDDPAHPAIYPTGNLPERELSVHERRIWDLITRRFMSVFGQPSVRQSMKVLIDVNGHTFYLRGRHIINEGWIIFYKPFIRSEDVILPALKEGQEVEVVEVIREDKFTKPPPRYNPSSLLQKMEEEGIGTKATRAEIIDTLYRRGYVSGERAVVSELGFNITEILDKYCPKVISVELTRDLERSMEEIQNGNEVKENVLSKAELELRTVLKELKSQQESLGQELSEAIRKARMEQRLIGDCPLCKTGDLVILYSKKTGKRFIGCTNFFEGTCKASFPLPQKGTVKPAARNCHLCEWPMITFKVQGRRPWTFCINPNCPSKEGKQK